MKKNKTKNEDENTTQDAKNYPIMLFVKSYHFKIFAKIRK
ncbi:hypothetical protein SAMN05660477_02509 [Soonwooa buanensis]|uniref:Uncharacterized protein n=1 Tax=Soonwooa buanensis TaxID=619805 RepID=A0A1T5G2E1_9FLAO|nr:hypothetical protein SAMN05660477_02509 [Soonwooa buanensis]